MKILIDDGMQIQVGTGIGKYSLCLYEALKSNSNIEIKLIDYKKSNKCRVIERVRYLKYINSKAFSEIANKNDMVHFTNYAMPFTHKINSKIAVTIHDLVAYMYPDTLPRFYRYFNQYMIKNSLKKADIIFTVSHSVRKEIEKYFPEYVHKVKVTWLGLHKGIRPMEKYPPYNKKELANIDNYPFFLFVSTVEKRKNVGMVLEAFIKLKANVAEAREYKLVIVGRPGYGYNNFVKKVKSSGFENDIIFSGYISDADCNKLYNHAIAYIFPTLYEGFGFSQIECMRCHLPIILSDIPTNREISKEYGEFFDLNNLESLVEKMKLFVYKKYDYNYKNNLADRYIVDFDWNLIANKYFEIYKKYLY